MKLDRTSAVAMRVEEEKRISLEDRLFQLGL
jgi:hypothetical protein